MQTGILDRTRLVSNILMLILLIGNIFFSIQYTQNVKLEAARVEAESTKDTNRVQISRFLKFFIDTVINTKGVVSFDDRVKLESDIRQIHDADLTKQWEVFVASKDTTLAQESAIHLMSMLTAKML